MGVFLGAQSLLSAKLKVQSYISMAESFKCAHLFATAATVQANYLTRRARSCMACLLAGMPTRQYTATYLTTTESMVAAPPLVMPFATIALGIYHLAGAEQAHGMVKYIC